MQPPIRAPKIADRVALEYYNGSGNINAERADHLSSRQSTSVIRIIHD
jgi:hypothetical protein